MKYLRVPIGDLVITKEMKKEIAEVMKSNRLSRGPKIAKFEKEFARMHGIKHAIFLSSGTDALKIAIAAMKEKHGWKDGDEIICPALTFVATSNTILMNNLNVRFVDVDRNFNINPDEIEAAITPRTKAIMVVHHFSKIAQMEKIMRIANVYNLRVIEDSCEAMFVQQNGKFCGSFGDISCFSTYINHIITTGVGGLICTNDDTLADLCLSLMNHGRDNIYIKIDDAKGKDLKQITSRRFNFERLGHSDRVTEMEAALGIPQLKTAKQNIAKRKAIVTKYNQVLSKYFPPICQPLDNCSDNAHMMYPLIIRDGLGVNRDDIECYLESRGVETRRLNPLLSQPFYRQMFGDLRRAYPTATLAEEKGLYIGCHPGLTKQQINHVLECFKDYFENAN